MGEGYIRFGPTELKDIFACFNGRRKLLLKASLSGFLYRGPLPVSIAVVLYIFKMSARYNLINMFHASYICGHVYVIMLYVSWLLTLLPHHTQFRNFKHTTKTTTTIANMSKNSNQKNRTQQQVTSGQTWGYNCCWLDSL